MTSLNFAGKCSDETCCKANAPTSQCRCYVSERIHQIERMRARLPKQPSFSPDKVVSAVWSERRRILAILLAEASDDDLGSPVSKYMERVAQRACEIKPADNERTEPLTVQEIALAREMDQNMMPPEGAM